MAKWNDIKDALYTMAEEMTIANGYNYNWVAYHNKDMHHPENIYINIETSEDGEENTDENNFTGTNEYRNTRKVDFYLSIDNLEAAPLDEVKKVSKIALEKGREDVLEKFNSCYNIAGDAGARNLQYKGFVFEKQEKGGRYNPYKMVMTYDIKYVESRNITL